MGFYPTEVIKQDSKRFGVPFLNPDINKSHINCIPHGERVLLGLRFVKDVGAKLAASILEERERNGIFGSVGDFVQRAIMKPAVLQSLVMAGTFDAMQSNRSLVLWETGLYSGSLRRQLPLPFIMDDDVPDLSDFSPYQRALSEYAVLGIYPKRHLMEFLRPGLEGVQTTAQVELAPEGKEVTVAGLVTTRQHPRGENGTVFVTVEDEHFYTQLILWPDVFHRCRDALRSPVIKTIGKVSRWDGTANIIASSVEAVNVPDGLPRSHDWH